MSSNTNLPATIEEVLEALTPARDIPEGEDCSICKEQYDREDHRPVETPCDHRFGWSCLASWLERSGTCPMCRKVVSGVASPSNPIYETYMTREHLRPREQEWETAVLDFVSMVRECRDRLVALSHRTKADYTPSQYRSRLETLGQDLEAAVQQFDLGEDAEVIALFEMDKLRLLGPERAELWVLTTWGAAGMARVVEDYTVGRNSRENASRSLQRTRDAIRSLENLCDSAEKKGAGQKVEDSEAVDGAENPVEDADLDGPLYRGSDADREDAEFFQFVDTLLEE